MADSICFFSERTGLSFNLADISDFVVRGLLTPCFRYDGMLAWESDDQDRYKRDTGFFGYLTTYELQDEFLRVATFEKTKISKRVFIKEMIRTMGIPEHLRTENKSFYLLDYESIKKAEYQHHVPLRELVKDYPEYVKGKIAEYREASSGFHVYGDILNCTAIHPAVNFDPAKEAIAFFEMTLFFSDIVFPYIEITAIIEGKNLQPEKAKEPNTAPTGQPSAEPITTLQAIGIMAELLALEDGCYKYRKGESNVNAKAIGVAVSNRAKARFGDNVRGFDSFNKKISEGLKALEKLEKK